MYTHAASQIGVVLKYIPEIFSTEEERLLLFYDFDGALNFCTFLRRRETPILLEGFVALVNQKLGSVNVHSCSFTDWCCARLHS
jgi:hypothetical protein